MMKGQRIPLSEAPMNNTVKNS